jgi:hypothetical protein
MRLSKLACERVWRLKLAWSMTLLVLASVGCESGGPPLAKVKGKVTKNGEAVTGGVVTLAPVEGGGFPASGQVNADGSFELSTSSAGDGAMIGKHLVTYAPPRQVQEDFEWNEAGEPPAPPPSPYDNLQPSQTEFEVKEGDNELNIELVKGA